VPTRQVAVTLPCLSLLGPADVPLGWFVSIFLSMDVGSDWQIRGGPYYTVCNIIVIVDMCLQLASSAIL
jgi:hypothetical protein